MLRFYMVRYGFKNPVLIYDILNPEPVCEIYEKHHPYAVDVILNALNRLGEVEMDKGN